MTRSRPEKSKASRKKKEGKKGKNEAEEEEVLVDTREPKNIRGSLLIWKYFGWDNIWILLGACGAMVSGAVPMLFEYQFGLAVGDMTPKTDTHRVLTSPIVNVAVLLKQEAMFKSSIRYNSIYFAVVSAIMLFSTIVQSTFMNLAYERLGNKLKKEYFDSLLDQEIGYFDLKRSGQLINDMADIEIIQQAYSLKLGDIIQGVVQIIVGVVLAIVAGWKMALIFLSIVPLVLVVVVVAGVATELVQSKAHAIIGQAASVSNEVISAMRTVRSMNGEEKEKRRYSNLLHSAHRHFFFKALGLGIPSGLEYFFVFGIMPLGFWYGGKLILRGEYTIGTMFATFGPYIMAQIGLSSLMLHLPFISKAEPAVKNMLKVIMREPGIRPSGGIAPNKLVGQVEFKDVTFSYPTRLNQQVLKHFNLNIQPGQMVALVGSSGSGKSTIVGLIEKFYVPDSGQILLDGNNLSDIDPRWLHRNIGIVTQEPTLFSGTLRQNIAYAVDYRSVSDEEIENAAKAACAHDFIMQLPKGYDTVIGERGVSLSGGQKQRIAIARAMIQNASLLLLDEATSALDTESEAIVQEALSRLMKGRTCIVIAHRLSTIVDSNVICVMHKGEIKEMGSHLELMQIPDGFYYKLAKKQFLNRSKA